MEPADNLPVTVYTPESPLRHPRAFVRGMLADIWKGRELAWRLFVRDLSAQYRQTYLGYFWAFLPPLVTAATFIFLQSQGIVNVDGLGMPYPAFVLIGTLLWQTFVEAIQNPLAAVQAAKPMLAKINFPREAILMSGLYMVLFNFIIRFGLLIAVLVTWHVSPGRSVLYFPVSILGLISLGFAVGILLVPLGALYGDVARAIPILSQFLMLITPVMYPLRYSRPTSALLSLNPAAPLITCARQALVGDDISVLTPLFSVVMCSLAACIVSVVVYRVSMPLVIERMQA